MNSERATMLNDLMKAKPSPQRKPFQPSAPTPVIIQSKKAELVQTTKGTHFGPDISMYFSQFLLFEFISVSSNALSIKEGQWADQRDLKKDVVVAVSTLEFPSLTGSNDIPSIEIKPQTEPQMQTTPSLPGTSLPYTTNLIYFIDFEGEKKRIAEELERKMQERQRKEVTTLFIPR